MPISVKILVAVSSLTSIGFGVWHFFVPRVWNWESYIDPRATELILAVRAINVFFSLALVLFGLLNLLFVYGGKANRYSIIVLLAATNVLWVVRVVYQVVYPQGTLFPYLQWGMLLAFLLVALGYMTALGLVLFTVKETTP